MTMGRQSNNGRSTMEELKERKKAMNEKKEVLSTEAIKK